MRRAWKCNHERINTKRKSKAAQPEDSQCTVDQAVRSDSIKVVIYKEHCDVGAARRRERGLAPQICCWSCGQGSRFKAQSDRSVVSGWFEEGSFKTEIVASGLTHAGTTVLVFEQPG